MCSRSSCIKPSSIRILMRQGAKGVPIGGFLFAQIMILCDKSIEIRFMDPEGMLEHMCIPKHSTPLLNTHFTPLNHKRIMLFETKFLQGRLPGSTAPPDHPKPANY